MITIHNLSKEQMIYPWDVSVDRQSPLGNPFSLYGDEDMRDDVCERYIEWIEEALNLKCIPEVICEYLRLVELYKQHGKLRLFCWCAPKRCHADTLKAYLEEDVIEGQGENDMTYINDDSRLDMSDMPGGDVVSPVMAFDCETELIDYKNPLPDMICMTYADAGAVKGTIETPWEHNIPQKFIDSWANMQHGVGHYVAFDLSMLAFNFPETIPHIFTALDNGLIHDTLLRERLLNLTLHGNFDLIEINGAVMHVNYSLVDLEKKYLNLDRSALKDDPDAPRLNYAMYKGVPLAKWNEKFISYAIDDSVNTGLIYMHQEVARQKCIEMTGHDPFAVETFRVKINFALRLLECVGELLDPEKVIEVTDKFRTEYQLPRLKQPLILAGLLLDALPPRPYAKGTLEHTDECTAAKDIGDWKKTRRLKQCGCPVKMKAAEPEHNPTKPLAAYIWNLAGTNPNIKAWPADKCVSNMKKAGVYKNIIANKAFKLEVVQGTLIDKAIGVFYNNFDEARATDNKKLLKTATEKLEFAEKLKAAGYLYMLPDDVTLTTDEEWNTTFSAHDPLLSIWAERRALAKIITDYLPKMFYTDDNGVTAPAAIIRPSFFPLQLTGRTSSRASTMYPSRNGQNVDPRVRPCTIPRQGNVIVSTDINGMELGTLAQKCVSLFGHSVMADNINNGVDNHAYLAAQIACAMDDDFNKLIQQQGALGNRSKTFEIFNQAEGHKEPMLGFETFKANFTAKYEKEKSEKLDRPVMWSDFFKYYRLLAKPTGLGFPGGLAAATMVAYAKGTYKVDLTFEVATLLKQVWLETYPEMGLYLDWIKKHCKDPLHAPVQVEEDDGTTRKKTFFCYDTPRGMHRARCGFCEAANGAGLQAFSAEGITDGMYDAVKAMWLAKPGDLLFGCLPWGFLHDELVWESPEDVYVGQRAKEVERLLCNGLIRLCPDVKFTAESAAMRRWSKYAEPIFSEDGNLLAWEPDKD